MPVRASVCSAGYGGDGHTDFRLLSSGKLPRTTIVFALMSLRRSQIEFHVVERNGARTVVSNENVESERLTRHSHERGFRGCSFRRLYRSSDAHAEREVGCRFKLVLLGTQIGEQRIAGFGREAVSFVDLRNQVIRRLKPVEKRNRSVRGIGGSCGRRLVYVLLQFGKRRAKKRNRGLIFSQA